jgi:ribonuclease R
LLEKKLEKKSPSQGERDFCKRTAEKLSQIEINLASAERASIALKQTEYMLNRKGEIRDGVISAVTEWGIYVQDIETQAEGLVRLRDLKGDFYLLDKENFSISGRKTKKRYSLGDRVKVKVVGGDLERKSLEYLFA